MASNQLFTSTMCRLHSNSGFNHDSCELTDFIYWNVGISDLQQGVICPRLENNVREYLRE